jgi:hypothetical protein
VIATAGALVFGPSGASAGFADSVDEDDGNIELGQQPVAGHSFGIGGLPAVLDLFFDVNALGVLPDHVGLVATDGFGLTTFEVFDANGNSPGPASSHDLFLAPGAEIARYSGNNNFFEDRFLGAIHSGGISRVRITQERGGIEIDHLQYGATSAAVSAPAAFALFVLALGLMGGRGAVSLPRKLP